MSNGNTNIQSKRISALTEINSSQIVANDLFVVADVSATETKKMTASQLQTYVLSGGSSSSSFSANAYTASVALSVAGIVDSASYAKSASWANWSINSKTSSYVTASNVYGRVSLASNALTASYAETTSYTQVITSFATSASLANTTSFLLYIPGGDNGTSTYSISSSFSALSPTSSFLKYDVGRSNGTASHAITSSAANNAMFLVYDATKNNGTSSYAISSSATLYSRSASYIAYNSLGFNEDIPVAASIVAKNSASIYVWVYPTDSTAKNTVIEVYGDVIFPVTNSWNSYVRMELEQAGTTWNLNTAALSSSIALPTDVNISASISNGFYLKGWLSMLNSYTLHVYASNGAYFDTSSRPITVGVKTKSNVWSVFN